MRAALAGICLLLSAACGAAPEPPDVAPPTVKLQTVGLLGALPPRERRVDVVIDGQGLFTINGEPCPWAELQARLIEVSGGPRSALVEEEEVDEQEIVIEEPVIRRMEEIEEEIEEEDAPAAERPEVYTGPQARTAGVLEPDGSRAADVLLRIDRRVPWVVVVRLLQTMAEPRVKLYRAWWAVTADDGSGEGALAVFLPKDRCGGGKNDDGVYPELVRARLRPDGESQDMRDLFSVVRALKRAADAPVLVSLDAPALTPWGQIVELADAALRAEADGFTTHGIWPIDEKKTVEQWLVEAGEAPALRLTLRTELEVDPRTARLPARRRSDGPIGFGNSAFSFVEEVIEEMDEEMDGDEGDAPFGAPGVVERIGEGIGEKSSGDGR